MFLSLFLLFLFTYCHYFFLSSSLLFFFLFFLFLFLFFLCTPPSGLLYYSVIHIYIIFLTSPGVVLPSVLPLSFTEFIDATPSPTTPKKKEYSCRGHEQRGGTRHQLDEEEEEEGVLGNEEEKDEKEHEVLRRYIMRMAYHFVY